MKRKIISLVMATCMFACVPQMVILASVEKENNIVENLKSVIDSAEVEAATNKQIFEIDENGILVGSIGWDEEVVIPDGVTGIGNYVFGGYEHIRDIKIPDSVKSIGDGAFNHCNNIKTIKIPNSVKNIGKDAFYNCSGLESIELPDSVTSIGMSSFSGCSSAKKVVISKNMTEIPSFAFSDLGAVETLEIPDGIKSIGDAAFCRMTNLKSIKIPDSVTYIGGAAFRECLNLKSIKLPSKITTIEDHTFLGCSSLEEIEIPSSVKSIGRGAFEECGNLRNVIISRSVTKIHSEAFNNSSKVIINGEKDSYAQKYALENKLPFKEISSDGEVAKKYKITFKENGGSKLSKKAKTVTGGKTYGALPTVVRKGYTFKGWYTKKNGGSKVTKNTKVTINSPHTLYAQWIKVKKPKRATISSIKNNKSKQMSVKLKKVSGAKGYEITYSMNQKFKSSNKTTTTSLNENIKKLKKGKTYYVKARAYKIDSAKKKVYGNYSSVYKIEIRK